MTFIATKYARGLAVAAAASVAIASGCAEILNVDFGEKRADLSDSGAGGTGNGGSAGAAPQCQNDEECKQIVLEGPSKCVNGQCVAECQTTSECKAKYGLSGRYACISGGCINLISEDCTKTYPESGSWDGDDPPPIFLGVLDDRSSPDWKADTVEYYWESFRLAQKQLESKIIGPGPAGGQRKIVLVECDEMKDPVRAARHLVENVRVPLVLGPAKYPNQLKVLEQVLAKPTNSAVALTRSALSVVLTHPSNQKGLVWSLSPPGNERAFALKALMAEQEAALRVRVNKTSGETLKVALLTVDDIGYDELNSIIVQTVEVGGIKVSDLSLNDFKKVVAKNHGACSLPGQDAGPPCEYNERADELLAFRPNVVIVNAPYGLFNTVVKRLEQLWETPLCGSDGGADADEADRPLYLAASWDYTSNYLLPFGACGPVFLPQSLNIAARIRTVDFFPPEPARYKKFLDEYLPHVGKTFAGPDSQMGLSYDSMFVAAYALTALLKDDALKTFTGKDVASAFSTLAQLGGQSVKTGSGDITLIDSLLEKPESIDLQGIFSRLAFDVTTRAAIFDVNVMCPNVDLASGLPGRASGQTFDITTAKLEGTYSCN